MTVTATVETVANTFRSQRKRETTMTLAVAVLGFFVVTFDAVVVNVALPTIGNDLGGGISGLQWVVDGYTLLFAALLISAGALSDRIGARRAFGWGLAAFVAASAVCGLAVSLPMLIAARVVQGAAAAIMMPSSMALIGEAYPDPRRRVHAIAIWAMGGAVASSCAPLLGGLLTELSWRTIFFINVPVGLGALLLLAKSPTSPKRPAQLDWLGQLFAVVTMGGLVFGVIEAGTRGLASAPVLTSLGLAILTAIGFVITERRLTHPMVPKALVRRSAVRVSAVIGFAFMVGFYGLPFIFSLYFQQLRGLSALATGMLFLPMSLIGFVLTPFSARLAQRVGAANVVTSGLSVMTVGMVAIAIVATPDTADWVLSVLLILIGLGGPLVMPMTTALLLEHVPTAQAGTASGVFNTSRQVGGALAIAVFGAQLAHPETFIQGVRTSLLIGTAVVSIAAVVSLRLHPHYLKEPV